jgi:hypothetical protein
MFFFFWFSGNFEERFCYLYSNDNLKNYENCISFLFCRVFVCLLQPAGMIHKNPFYSFCVLKGMFK